MGCFLVITLRYSQLEGITPRAHHNLEQNLERLINGICPGLRTARIKERTRTQPDTLTQLNARALSETMRIALSITSTSRSQIRLHPKCPEHMRAVIERKSAIHRSAIEAVLCDDSVATTSSNCLLESNLHRRRFSNRIRRLFLDHTKVMTGASPSVSTDPLGLRPGQPDPPGSTRKTGSVLGPRYC